jgi:hypothetical protein
LRHDAAEARCRNCFEQIVPFAAGLRIYQTSVDEGRSTSAAASTLPPSRAAALLIVPRRKQGESLIQEFGGSSAQ